MDIQYLLWLQEFRGATIGCLNTFFLLITHFGESYFPYLLALGIYWAVDRDLGQKLIFSMSGSGMLNGLMKLSVCAYRPWIRSSAVKPVEDALGTATGYSFPSGHTMNATSVYGLLAIHYRRKKEIMIGFLFLLFCVMFSRNYLGVHTPQDVLLGFTVAALWAFVSVRLVNWINADPGHLRDVKVVIVAVLVVIAALLFYTHKSYPMDYDAAGKLLVDPAVMMQDSFTGCGCLLGCMFGFLVERRWVRFSTKVDGETKAIRFFTGMLMYIVLINIVGILFLGVFGLLWGRLFASAFVFFFCVALHPMIFQHREARQSAQEKQKVA